MVLKFIRNQFILTMQTRKSFLDRQEQRQIIVTDRQIDELVYELYDLTPEEIAVVEGK